MTLLLHCIRTRVPRFLLFYPLIVCRALAASVSRLRLVPRRLPASLLHAPASRWAWALAGMQSSCPDAELRVMEPVLLCKLCHQRSSHTDASCAARPVSPSLQATTSQQGSGAASGSSADSAATSGQVRREGGAGHSWLQLTCEPSPEGG